MLLLSIAVNTVECQCSWEAAFFHRSTRRKDQCSVVSDTIHWFRVCGWVTWVFLEVISSLTWVLRIAVATARWWSYQEHRVLYGQRIWSVIQLPCWKVHILTLPRLVHLLYDECKGYSGSCWEPMLQMRLSGLFHIHISGNCWSVFTGSCLSQCQIDGVKSRVMWLVTLEGLLAHKFCSSHRHKDTWKRSSLQHA